MRFHSQLFILVAGFISISFSSFGQGISMSPTRLFFTGQPGETVTQTVTLSNSSKSDYIFNINLKDWEREEDGNKVYSPSNTLKNSNANWISTLESTLSLPAGTSKEIVVKMKIPENASTKDVSNSMLFFTQIGQQKDEEEKAKTIGIIALFEFGLHVYYTPVNNMTQSLEILNVADLKKDSLRTAAVEIKNDGNIVCDATVELELTNKETGKEIKLIPINISLMPETIQKVHFTLPANLKGNYLGVVLIKMSGTNDLRIGEKNFEF